MRILVRILRPQASSPLKRIAILTLFAGWTAFSLGCGQSETETVSVEVNAEQSQSTGETTDETTADAPTAPEEPAEPERPKILTEDDLIAALKQ